MEISHPICHNEASRLTGLCVMKNTLESPQELLEKGSKTSEGPFPNICPS